MDFTQIRDYSEFCEQLSDMRIRFHKWDSCERTVALYYLMSGLPFANARFLQHVLEHCISNVVTPELQQLERNANDVVFIRSLLSERLHIALNRLLIHLPLLRPGNKEIADSYLTVIRKVLTEYMSPPYKIYNDCVEIMSYLLIHPAFDKEDKKSFNQLLRQMVNRVCPESFNHSPVNEQLSDESISPNPEPVQHLNVQQPEACLRIGRRSNSLTPVQTNSHENLVPSQDGWSSQENLASTPQKQRSYSLSNDKSLPLNVPNTITSSSSETRLQDLQTMSNLPVMKGIVFWLKSLRLHKYSWVFTNLTYEQMLNLNEDKLQVMGITKGARHKLLLSIAKLKERSTMMTELETEVMNGGDLLAALKKLKAVLQSPLQITSGEDLPSQFVKVMGKVCTQLLMLRQPPEESMTLFSSLCERAETLEAFNVEQQRRLALWRAQLSHGTTAPVPVQRNSIQCNNSRQQTVQSQYYLPVSGISYPPQVYNQKSSSYPNVQANNAVGAHRNSLGSLSHNVNMSTIAPPKHVSINKSTELTNHYPYTPVSNGTQYNTTTISQVRFSQNNDEKKNDKKTIMKNTDIESSLESLCLQMMEHALGP